MNLYLFLAVFWFVLGVALEVAPRLNPNAFHWMIPGTAIAVGWLALALSCYNLVRWRLMRGAARRRALEEGPRPDRRRHSSGPPPQADPNFDFTDPPSEPK